MGRRSAGTTPGWWIQPLAYTIVGVVALGYAKLDSSHNLLKGLDAVVGFSDYVARKVTGSRIYSRVVYFDRYSPNKPQDLHFTVFRGEQATLHVYNPIYQNVPGTYLNVDNAALTTGQQLTESTGTFDQLEKYLSDKFLSQAGEHVLSVLPALKIKKNQKTPAYYMSLECRIEVKPGGAG
ncbi:MAG TPA: hypothetical protein VN224_02000 [Xanthomonadales bacterium]|nr:hypothetical protein [Xanthomonadales bacterium]